MYLIIIKSSFNYYIYIYSRLRCTRREPNCRNAFSLSLVANTTAVTASTSIVSIIIIISFALFILSPFLFSSVYVVVLAGTTTEFSSFLFGIFFFFLLFPRFFSSRCEHCFLSASTLFSWLAIRRKNMMMNEHFASSYAKRGRRRRRTERERYHGVPLLLLCRHRSLFVLILFFFVITLLQTPSLFSFFLISIFFFPRYFELDINRQFSSVNRMIIDAEDDLWMITTRYHRIQIVSKKKMKTITEESIGIDMYTSSLYNSTRSSSILWRLRPHSPPLLPIASSYLNLQTPWHVLRSFSSTLRSVFLSSLSPSLCSPRSLLSSVFL